MVKKDKVEYSSLNLPKKQIEQLKTYKRAYCFQHNRNITYSKLMEVMMQSLEQTQPQLTKEENKK